uniref:Histidine--tRNA ligase, cytoplasmic n=1 Tax=Rhizophora mucronata TaxID=61149 RepID=A0A2P2J5Q9_RHIMU
MARRGEVVTVGGKVSSLSSSSVYAVAAGLAQVRIDSSALDRLSDQDQKADPKSLKQSPNALLKTLSPLEVRASLTILLSNLLHSSNSAAIASLLCDTLNSSVTESLDLDSIDVTEESVLYGIYAVLDHEATALSKVVDVVAALSCEAVRGDVSIFNLIDTGDGHVDKDRVGVASDIKVLLNGSKLVGRVESESLSKIPIINGKLREVVRSVHSITRAGLNCRVRAGKYGEQETVGTTASPLAVVLRNLGESSLCRTKMNLDAVAGGGLKDHLLSMFEKSCPSGDALKNSFRFVLDLLNEENYGKFLHEVNTLLGFVWKIVAWEGITSFVALEGGELLSSKGTESVEANGGDGKAEKKSEKKKKKVVLGKGTSVMVQIIKDRLQSKRKDSGEAVEILDQCAQEILLSFNPRESEFNELVNKVKEIVESNESRRLPKLPKGTRDFAKEQMAIREKAFSIITEVFKRHGATALDTPAFELRETLMGKYGEDSKLIYDLADQGGELCSLRYDLTVPFARYVAMNGLTSFRRYQIAKVYRRDNPSKGRYREFYQCDFDIAGQYEEMGPDFEIIKILTELLDELDIGDYEVKLNHRKLLDGMLEICGVPPEKFRSICSSIDKLDKQTFEQVKKEMVEEKGLNSETADRIGSFVKERGPPKELLSRLKQKGSSFLDNASSKCALDDLEILFEALQNSKCINKVVFDLSLARGLDYYTGVIFEAVGTMQVGSIAAGGRYDNLIGMFGTKQVPAVGVSLGIERVFTMMEQLQKDRNQTARPTETQVLLSILGDKRKLCLAAELVSELWNARLKAEYVVSTRFSKHIDRARESRIPWMVLVGDKEMEKGIVKIKNIETTIEEEVPRTMFVEELRQRLNP